MGRVEQLDFNKNDLKLLEEINIAERLVRGNKYSNTNIFITFHTQQYFLQIKTSILLIFLSKIANPPRSPLRYMYTGIESHNI